MSKKFLLFYTPLFILFVTFLILPMLPKNHTPFSSEILKEQDIQSSNWSQISIVSETTLLSNTGDSNFPAIAVDSTGALHVVWRDWTDGWWGTDAEIMYAKYSTCGIWLNYTIISDDTTQWNTGDSDEPAIAVDTTGNVHVVWQDLTSGWWETDSEIMYANYTVGVGWSNATVISDDATLWNTGNSFKPAIAVDGTGNVHVVWYDWTDGW